MFFVSASSVSAKLEHVRTYHEPPALDGFLVRASTRRLKTSAWLPQLSFFLATSAAVFPAEFISSGSAPAAKKHRNKLLICHLGSLVKGIRGTQNRALWHVDTSETMPIQKLCNCVISNCSRSVSLFFMKSIRSCGTGAFGINFEGLSWWDR